MRVNDGKVGQRNPPLKTALVQAVDLLAAREHSSRKLAEKLERKGHSPAEIAAAIARLTERGCLNDEEACERQFLRLLEESGKSVREIEAVLLRRGFERSAIAAVQAAVNDEEMYARERRAAYARLCVKFRKGAEKEQCFQYLCRQGYSFSVARDAYEAYCKEREDV